MTDASQARLEKEMTVEGMEIKEKKELKKRRGF